MKTAMKRKLSLKLLLALVLIVTMFAALAINASAADDAKYLAFTSDSHYNTSNAKNNLDVWMTNLKTAVSNVDYFGFCGDLGSAYATSASVYWDYAKAFMDTADSYVTSGFITKGNIFAFGNHEWYPSAGGDYANNKDNAAAKRLSGPIGEAANTDDYIIYCFSATSGTAQYTNDDLATLKAYLDKAPTDKPIVILTHFPLHFYGGRTTNNSAAAIDLLNNYPNVIFLWGHNHTVSDPNYDKVYVAGDSITIPGNTQKQINFTYCSAGCMSDSEYGPGSAFVKGKGLLMEISGTNVTLTYYDLNGKTLEAAVKTVDITKSAPVVDNTPHTVVLSSQAVTVDGAAKALEVYNIDGSNYFKLRDMAYVLNSTGSQFSVGYDAAAKSITCKTGEAYTADGTELKIGEDKSASAVPSTQSLYIDGKAANLSAFNIGGNNFFKLRDLGAALSFNVDYDDATRTMLITSNQAESTEDKGEPVGKVYFYAILDTEVCKDTKGTQIAYYPVDIYKGDTVADAITTLHQVAYGDGKAWAFDKNDTYGYYLTKMWGKDVGDLTYGGGGIWTDFSAGKHADPAAAVADGSFIYIQLHTGSTLMRTGYFDKQYVELKAGDSLELTYNRCSGDGAVKACTDSDVQINGEAAGKTDGSAKITLKFDKAGIYIVTGIGKNSYGTAVCYVVVK